MTNPWENRTDWLVVLVYFHPPPSFLLLLLDTNASLEHYHNLPHRFDRTDRPALLEEKIIVSNSALDHFLLLSLFLLWHLSSILLRSKHHFYKTDVFSHLLTFPLFDLEPLLLFTLSQFLFAEYTSLWISVSCIPCEQATAAIKISEKVITIFGGISNFSSLFRKYWVIYSVIINNGSTCEGSSFRAWE
jgi:hypothetical protein